MRNTKLRLAIAFVAAVFVSGPVAAEKFKLSYNFNFGSVLEIELTGELLEDEDTVIVSTIETVRFDGAVGPALIYVTSLADLVDGTELNDPVLTFSGPNNDISICADNTCTTDFITFDGIKQYFGKPGIYTSPLFGGTYSGGTNAAEEYDPKNYSLRKR